MPPKEANISLSLLSRAHSPDTALRIHTEKVIQRPLHLKPTDSTSQQTRRTTREQSISKRHKKRKPPPLSSRKKRALCLYDLPKSSQKYEIYVELHKLWTGYIHELLGLEGRKGVIGTGDAAKLCSADFHGAEMEVVRSRCVSRVGVKGIVVKDSMHVFEVVTKKDQVKVVPKEGTIFRFCLPLPGEGKDVGDEVKQKDGQGEGKLEVGEKSEKGIKKKELVFELHGDQFICRAADRANKKFKPHFLKDL